MKGYDVEKSETPNDLRITSLLIWLDALSWYLSRDVQTLFLSFSRAWASWLSPTFEDLYQNKLSWVMTYLWQKGPQKPVPGNLSHHCSTTNVLTIKIFYLFFENKKNDWEFYLVSIYIIFRSNKYKENVDILYIILNVTKSIIEKKRVLNWILEQ